MQVKMKWRGDWAFWQRCQWKRIRLPEAVSSFSIGRYQAYCSSARMTKEVETLGALVVFSRALDSQSERLAYSMLTKKSPPVRLLCLSFIWDILRCRCKAERPPMWGC